MALRAGWPGTSYTGGDGWICVSPSCHLRARRNRTQPGQEGSRIAKDSCPRACCLAERQSDETGRTTFTLTVMPNPKRNPDAVEESDTTDLEDIDDTEDEDLEEIDEEEDEEDPRRHEQT